MTYEELCNAVLPVWFLPICSFYIFIYLDVDIHTSLFASLFGVL